MGVKRVARSRGALENEILACLASADAPLTTAEVQARLSNDLAYTTLLTALTRLHSKRAVDRVERGRAYAYSIVGGAAGPHASVAAHRMHRLLDAGEDRTGVLMRFVAELRPEDEATLIELLREDNT